MEIQFTNGRPQIIEDIRNQVIRTSIRKQKAGVFGEPARSGPDAGLLRVKKASDWMAQEYSKPLPRMLFGEFWFEGELCILFADTNLGKSILAVQIGNNLAQGNAMHPFNNELEPGSPVLYIDFELGAKQFESRYRCERFGSYLWADSFYRAEFNPEADDPLVYDNYQDYLYQAIEHAITQSGARVLIIDNLTYMRSGTERAKDALPLMKHLKALKTKHQLSVLALAHTPKRNPHQPLTVNDLQGSKMIINFCDSAFAIGESHTSVGGRYLKQIKQRTVPKLYGEEQVCLCHIHKHLNLLMFEFDGFAHEREHLKRPEKHNRELLKQQALQLRDQGLSQRQISRQLGVSVGTVNGLLSSPL